MDAIKKIIQVMKEIGLRNIIIALAASVFISLSGGVAVNYYFDDFRSGVAEAEKVQEVGYSEFLKLVDQGKIASVEMRANKIEAD